MAGAAANNDTAADVAACANSEVVAGELAAAAGGAVAAAVAGGRGACANSDVAKVVVVASAATAENSDVAPVPAALPFPVVVAGAAVAGTAAAPLLPANNEVAAPARSNRLATAGDWGREGTETVAGVEEARVAAAVASEPDGSGGCVTGVVGDASMAAFLRTASSISAAAWRACAFCQAPGRRCKGEKMMTSRISVYLVQGTSLMAGHWYKGDPEALERTRDPFVFVDTPVLPCPRRRELLSAPLSLLDHLCVVGSVF